MLRYFRLNDPYRLIIIFLLLLGIRLPFMIGDGALVMPELNYMLIGEKLNSGAALYEGLWENIAPFSALVYAAIDFCFGRSQLAYQLISLFLVTFQCLIFNKLLLDGKAYNENTYVPGLIYGLLMSYFFDFFTLPPVLLSITFLLFALDHIFNHVEYRAKEDEKILNIGLLLGVSYLFYLPNIIYGLATLLIFSFFTGTVLRRYLLMLFGFILPLILTACYFLLVGRLGIFVYNFLNALFDFHFISYMSVVDVAIILSVPLLLLLFAFVRIGQRARFTNYQARLTQLMFVWLVFSIVFVVLSGDIAPNTFMIFVPTLAFFITHYFLLIQKRWVAEIVFALFVVCVVMFNLGIYYNFFFVGKYIDYTEYVVEDGKPEWEGKKVLILDDDIKPYVNAKPATPFMNWYLSEELFRKPDYYDNLSILYQGLTNDAPDIIVDTHGVMPAVFQKLPKLNLQYRKEGNLYYKKTNS